MSNQFVILYDQVGSAATREEKRADHIGYRKALGPAMILSGPLLDAEGGSVGSMIILAAQDEAEAQKIAGGDPFVQFGVLAIRSVNRMRIAALNPPA